MQKTALMISSLLILALPLQAHAARGGEKGPGDSAWEHANENAKFKREDEKLKKDKHKKEKHSHDGEDDHKHDRRDDREDGYRRDRDSDRDGRRDRDNDDSDREGRRERERDMRNEDDRVRDGERRSGFRWPWSRDTNPAE